jgi:hypothetical protein
MAIVLCMIKQPLLSYFRHMIMIDRNTSSWLTEAHQWQSLAFSFWVYFCQTEEFLWDYLYHALSWLIVDDHHTDLNVVWKEWDLTKEPHLCNLHLSKLLFCKQGYYQNEEQQCCSRLQVSQCHMPELFFHLDLKKILFNHEWLVLLLINT